MWEYVGWVLTFRLPSSRSMMEAMRLVSRPSRDSLSRVRRKASRYTDNCSIFARYSGASSSDFGTEPCRPTRLGCYEQRRSQDLVSGGGTHFGGGAPISGGGTHFGGGPTPYFSPHTPNHKGPPLCTFGSFAYQRLLRLPADFAYHKTSLTRGSF